MESAKNKMSILVHGNPFTTPVGQLVEKATDVALVSEDWGLNMEICDVVNESDDGPKDAVKALRKRLQQQVAGKNYTVVMYALTVLETCVKNCGRRFHVQVANKDFLHDLIKIIGPKNDPPQIVQEKILSLLQTWADAFRGNPELKEVEKVYQDLKAKGIEFPMTDLDAMAPIHTPARSAPDGEPATFPADPSMGYQPAHMMAYQPQPMGYPVQQPAAYPQPPAGYPQLPAGYPQPPAGYPQPMGYPQQQQTAIPASGPVTPTTEQLSKLHNEMEVVRGNIRVMSEMLSELVPDTISPQDQELLEELNATSRTMQQRIVDILTKIGNEEVTNELLVINDELNNVFLRYDRFVRNRSGAPTPAQTPADEQLEASIAADDHAPPSYDQLSAASNPNVGNLIDFDPSPASANGLPSQFSDLNVGTADNLNTGTTTTNRTSRTDDDFDMFAQSRQSFDNNMQTIGSEDAYRNQAGDAYTVGLGQAVNVKNNPDTAGDYDEMEKWLETHDASGAPPAGQVTSAEFDQFLAERATAAERLPDINATNTGSRTARQMQSDKEDTMFAL